MRSAKHSSERRRDLCDSGTYLMLVRGKAHDAMNEVKSGDNLDCKISQFAIAGNGEFVIQPIIRTGLSSESAFTDQVLLPYRKQPVAYWRRFVCLSPYRAVAS